MVALRAMTGMINTDEANGALVVENEFGSNRNIMPLARRNLRPLPGWATRLNRLITHWVTRNSADFAYLRANCHSVGRVIDGLGPDSPKADPRAGARMVVNLSSAHIPAFCRASAKGDPKPYKNGYDLAPFAEGRKQSPPISPDRAAVDAALPLPTGTPATEVYFGAVELNGSGIRFYGDVCLVLKWEAVAENTILLDRNSYDVLRSPERESIAGIGGALLDARKTMLARWSGMWRRDVGAMAAIKALVMLGARDRRWTTGQISEAVRSDEDYLEVLKIGSFRAADLQEARISPAEAAGDAWVGTGLARSPRPRMELLIWRDRRTRAETALRRSGVRLHVNTSSGRVRS